MHIRMHIDGASGFWEGEDDARHVTPTGVCRGQGGVCTARIQRIYCTARLEKGDYNRFFRVRVAREAGRKVLRVEAGGLPRA